MTTLSLPLSCSVQNPAPGSTLQHGLNASDRASNPELQDRLKQQTKRHPRRADKLLALLLLMIQRKKQVRDSRLTTALVRGGGASTHNLAWRKGCDMGQQHNHSTETCYSTCPHQQGTCDNTWEREEATQRWPRAAWGEQGKHIASTPTPRHRLALPSKPARSRRFSGYQSRGRLPTGSSGLGMLEVRSVIREPPPAAITTAWNSMLRREHRGRAPRNLAEPGRDRVDRLRFDPAQLYPAALPGAMRRLPGPRVPRSPYEGTRTPSPAVTSAQVTTGSHRLTDSTAMAAPARTAHARGEPSASIERR